MYQVQLHILSQLEFVKSLLPFPFSIPCPLSLIHLEVCFVIWPRLWNRFIPCCTCKHSHIQIKDSDIFLQFVGWEE